MALRWLRLALTIWLASWAAPMAAQGNCPTAQLALDKSFRADLGAFVCVLVDEDLALTIDDITAPETSEMLKPVETGLIDFGFGAARYWVRVNLQNPSDEAGTWWITHDLPIPDEMNVRLVREGGQVETLLELAKADPFGARTIPHRHLMSVVSFAPNEQATLVIDYRTSQSTQMPIFAESVSEFLGRAQSETGSHIALIALILGMGLISTLYFFSLEGWPAMVYGAYVLVTSAMLAQMEGYLFQFAYPTATWFNGIGFAIFGSASLCFALLFLVRLTSTRAHQPILYMIVLFTVAVLIILAGMSAFFLATAWYKLLMLGATVVGSIVQVAVIIGAIMRKQSGAWLLLLGFITISGAIALVTLGYMTEGLFPQELAGSAIRGGHLLEAVAFSGAIALRIRDARNERDHSLHEQLRLSQERLRLSEALRTAEDERQAAETAAVDSRQALASAAHDIRQPLASIQMALTQGALGSSQIAGSLSYIEGIVKDGLENKTTPAGTGDKDPVQKGTRESFPASLILNNISTMLSDEAAKNGAVLEVVPTTIQLHADPLVLMRAVSNLVSNAVAHADASRILIGTRRKGDRVRIEIHDNGKGMTERELKQMLVRGESGPTSKGLGLGTSIVTEIAEDNGFEFNMQSIPGRGTSATLTVPADTRAERRP